MYVMYDYKNRTGFSFRHRENYERAISTVTKHVLQNVQWIQCWKNANVCHFSIQKSVSHFTIPEHQQTYVFQISKFTDMKMYSKKYRQCGLVDVKCLNEHQRKLTV